MVSLVRLRLAIGTSIKRLLQPLKRILSSLVMMACAGQLTRLKILNFMKKRNAVV